MLACLRSEQRTADSEQSKPGVRSWGLGGKSFASFGLLAPSCSAAVALLGILCLLTQGCSPEWKRKFVREKKDLEGPQPILVLHSGEQALHPPRARYREHFALWKSWQTDLIASLGQIRKRDLRYLEGAVAELESMHAVLTPGGSADRLQGIVAELSQLHDAWQERQGYPWQVPTREKLRLEQLMRQINREYHYANVLESIPTPPPEEEAGEKGQGTGVEGAT